MFEACMIAGVSISILVLTGIWSTLDKIEAWQETICKRQETIITQNSQILTKLNSMDGMDGLNILDLTREA